MLFNSYPFLFAYLPVVLLGFFALGRRSPPVAAGFLAAASLFFYGWWDPAFVGLLLGSIVFNYAFGVWIAKAASPARRRALLLAALAGDLLTLCYFKYAGFLLGNLDALLGTRWSLGAVVLPLGISFFTFTQIAFLVDAYRGEVREHDFVHYCLFVTYFPHLIAGPVLHHKEMMPQFARGETYRPRAENFSVGSTVFFIGLFKKVVIADACSPLAAALFGAKGPAAPGLREAWMGTLAYALQIYFDFSGYSDMALGLSRLFGVTLPLNFHSPYKAVNITDFWRRWHMTLSRFLRDYLYIPLGGNRRGPARRYLNLLLTMLLGGLWHGAGWTFVIWGGLHGAYLGLHHAWREARRRLGHDLSRSTLPGRAAGRALTFAAVCAAWVFFRAESPGSALAVLRGLGGLNGAGTAPVSGDARWLLPLLLAVWLLPNTQELMAGFKPALGVPEPDAGVLAWRPRWSPSWGWLALTAAVALRSVAGLSERVSEFLYYKF